MKMGKEKRQGSKRKSVDDDSFDDSFDFFLPNKLKEKMAANQSKINSQSMFGKTRKKISPTSSTSISTSSSSQETYDTDMENVMAICLSKVPSTSFSAIGDRDTVGGHWKTITNKMKRRHTLLLKRTPEEREAILSQKLALILVESEQENTSYSLCNMKYPVESVYLLENFCQACRLWNLSKKPPEKLKDFYITAFYNYIEFKEDPTEEVHLPTTLITTECAMANSDGDNCTDLVEDMFPKECRQTVCEPDAGNNEDEKSLVDIFEASSPQKESVVDNNARVPSPGISSQSTIDLGAAEKNLHSPPAVVTDYSSADIPAENIVIELSSSLSNTPDIQLSPPRIGSGYDGTDSQKTLSPTPSIAGSMSTMDKNTGMLDRMGISLLADQWDRLFDTINGDVTVSLEDMESIKVHRFVLMVRCQPLLCEINEESILVWNMYSKEVAKAFFRYVYCGKSDHLWHLTRWEKCAVKRLARFYNLLHLEELLIKLHNSDTFQMFGSKCAKEISLPVQRQLPSPLSSSSFLRTSPVPRSSKLSLESSEYNVVDIVDKQKPSSPLLQNKFGPPTITVDKDGGEFSSTSTMDINVDFNLSISPNQMDVNIAKEDVLAQPSGSKYCTVKKSLEAYFHDSFPDFILPSDEPNTSVTKSNIPPVSNLEMDSISLSSDDLTSDEDKPSNALLRSDDSTLDTPPLSSADEQSDDECLPLYTSEQPLQSLPSTPTTSQSLSPTHKRLATILQNTPSTSNAEIIYSKDATPLPNYDDMVTPQLKKELKKYGLKDTLGKAKSKLLLKYIYDQTHPVVTEQESKTPSPPHTISNSEQHKQLVILISKLVKSNDELYAHILQFKPIWLDNFHKFLKENGILCSVGDLKDALNELCIIYRSRNNRKPSIRKTRRKKKKPFSPSQL